MLAGGWCMRVHSFTLQPHLSHGCRNSPMKNSYLA
jgi:hypothetical protein